MLTLNWDAAFVYVASGVAKLSAASCCGFIGACCFFNLYEDTLGRSFPRWMWQNSVMTFNCFFCNVTFSTFLRRDFFLSSPLHLLVHPHSAASARLNFEFTFLSRSVRDRTAPLSRVPPSPPNAPKPCCLLWAGYLQVIKKRLWLPRPTRHFIPQRWRGCSLLISRPL